MHAPSDYEELGVPLQVAVKGDKFVIAIGNDALEDALEPSGTLGDSDTYKDATGLLAAGSNPALFVDIPQIVDLVENLTDNDPGFQDLKPYLDAFGPLVAGTRTSDGSPVTQISVGIND